MTSWRAAAGIAQASVHRSKSRSAEGRGARARRGCAVPEGFIAAWDEAASIGAAEADLGGFALGRGRDFEEFARFEIEHAGDDVGRELRDFRVEVADDGIVVAAGVLDRVLELIEGLLELRKAFDGTQLRIGFGKREDLPQGGAKHSFGLALRGGTGGRHGLIARGDDAFEGALLVAGIAFDGFDEVGDEVVAALELYIYIGPGVVALDLEAHQPVVDRDDGDRDHDDND